MKKTFYFITIISLALTACISHKNTPATETFSLTPTSTTALSSELQNPIIRMMPATIESQFSNSFFIYRTSSIQYFTDPYRRFLSSPNIEISSYLENKLPISLKGSLIAADSLATENFILQENISELYADYRNKAAPQAVVAIQFILYTTEHGKTTQIASINLREQTAIKPNDAASLLAGYAHDLDVISQQAADFINTSIAKSF